jgi:hypothetical protein
MFGRSGTPTRSRSTAGSLRSSRRRRRGASPRAAPCRALSWAGPISCGTGPPRWEALLIAAFGLLAALGVGIFFGWVLVQALQDEGFSSFVIPFGTMITVTVIMGTLTLVAAVFPAWSAGRRPILKAITQD